MLRSMTGYGRAVLDTTLGELSWELRSVNHRFLEVQVRLPEELRSLERSARERLGGQLHRGKVEAVLRFQAKASEGAKIQLDAHVLASLNLAVKEVKEVMSNTTPVDPLQVIQWPGVQRTENRQLDTTLSEPALVCLDSALSDLLATREREGEKTKAQILTRAQHIHTSLEQLKQHRPAVVTRQREKLLSKLQELNIDHDSQRLEQELVYVAQRLDIDEELDRLETHLVELHRALEREEPIGRRLDFLMQEFNREANTISSKSSDVDTTGASVDIKVLIEQMREQIQNIE